MQHAVVQVQGVLAQSHVSVASLHTVVPSEHASRWRAGGATPPLLEARRVSSSRQSMLGRHRQKRENRG